MKKCHFPRRILYCVGMRCLLMFMVMMGIFPSPGEAIFDPYTVNELQVPPTDPCTVTKLQVTADNNTSSVRYSATVLNTTLCRATYDKPHCNNTKKSNSGIKARLVVYQPIQVPDVWELKYNGNSMCIQKKRRVRIKCGNYLSDEVEVPGINVGGAKFTAIFWNDSALKISINSHRQVKDFQVYVTELHDLTNIIAKSNRVKLFTEVIVTGNYTPGTCYKLRIIPTLLEDARNCIAQESISVEGVCLVTQVHQTPSSPSPNYIYTTLGVISIVLLIIALLAGFTIYRQKPDPAPPIQDFSYVKHDRVVLVVHTQESENLRLEVKDLIITIQKTNIKQIYDIFDIRDHQILSNAEPWLLEQLNLQEQTYFILVWSPGLFKLLKAIRRGDTDADAVGSLGRDYLPSDCLLLSFLRFLNDSSFKYNCKRLFAVRFEDIEDSEKIQEHDVGMTDIGLSTRLYSLPSHYQDFHRAFP